MKLAWNYDYLVDGDGAQHVLQLVGIKIAEDGSIEEIIHHQPLATMNQCSVEVELPYCNCCKTYWYGFFVNPMDGTFTTSNYFGTCSCELPEYTEDNCLTCNDYVQLSAPEPATPPTDCPDGDCGENGNVNPADIVYNGVSQIYDAGNDDISLIIPTAVEAAFDLPILAEVTRYETYSLNIAADFVLRAASVASPSATISIADTDANIQTIIADYLKGDSVETVSVTRLGDNSIDLEIAATAAVVGIGFDDSATGTELPLLSGSRAKATFTTDSDAALSVMNSAGETMAGGTGQVSVYSLVGTEPVSYSVEGSRDGNSVTKTFEVDVTGTSISEVIAE